MMQERLIAELSEEKVRLLEKYRLVPKELRNRIYWVRQFTGKPDHPFATHRAMRNCHVLELVFSFYDLCVAKMTYFRTHLCHYTPCTLDCRAGRLVPCELWDMEFLVQRETGIVVDLRNLAAISDIAVFRELCAWLEEQLQQHRRLRDARSHGTLTAFRQRSVPVRRHHHDMHSVHHGGIPCTLV